MGHLAGPMTALRWLLQALGAWIGLVVVLVAGLVMLATSVETASHGIASFWLGTLAVPGLLVVLAPASVGMGVALGAARMDGRGERVALQACGLGPFQTALAAAILGTTLGIAALVAADHVVPWAEGRAATLRGRPGPDWVWLEEGALRSRDGLLVQVVDGRIQALVTHAGPDARLVARQQALQEPRTATGADLAGATSQPARVEWLARRTRVLSCLLLAVFAWLPQGAGTSVRLGRRLVQILLFVALDQSLLAIGAQGRLTPAAAALGAPLAAAAAVLLPLVTRRAPMHLRRRISRLRPE
jgi:Lipopolysaccharide export system permease LptF/LptG